MSVNVNVQSETEYEDLLSLWSDLEAGLGVLLSNPSQVQEFEQRVGQYDRWMQALLQRDPDIGLYLLFQLATNSPVGYSASHALVSAVLCHLLAVDLKLSTIERTSLVGAALTMNIGMTQLQDELAGQADRPNVKQLELIRSHSAKGSLMLANLGIDNELWLDVVSMHHDDRTDQGDLHTVLPNFRLARILRIVDRYAAMISPRHSRTGRSTADSIRSILGTNKQTIDEVGHALIRVVGLYPPGTYVRLEDSAIAVVMRRSSVSNLPHVAIVIDGVGDMVAQPRLHRTSVSEPRIQGALAASAVRLQLNHHLVLQLSAHAALNG
jgi:HD-GYP domain-containing protein (c-di-GMP phosphodiesterase class II)